MGVHVCPPQVPHSGDMIGLAKPSRYQSSNGSRRVAATELRWCLTSRRSTAPRMWQAVQRARRNKSSRPHAQDVGGSPVPSDAVHGWNICEPRERARLMWTDPSNVPVDQTSRASLDGGAYKSGNQVKLACGGEQLRQGQGREAAAFLHEPARLQFSVHKLPRFRARGGGPKYVRPNGRDSRYWSEWLLEWADGLTAGPVRSVAEEAWP